MSDMEMILSLPMLNTTAFGYVLVGIIVISFIIAVLTDYIEPRSKKK